MLGLAIVLTKSKISAKFRFYILKQLTKPEILYVLESLIPSQKQRKESQPHRQVQRKGI